jgi:hypothetical protein
VLHSESKHRDCDKTAPKTGSEFREVAHVL